MARSGPGRLHGYLVIDKPAGWTSHDVVGKVRRLTGERRVGHAGTLDPAATGVLPVAVGLATRSLEYIADGTKTYLAEITFGVSTDSYDGDGRVTATADASGLTSGEVAAALAELIGPGWQVPPMHSAIQIGGKRLYELARRGETVERDPRPVTFHALDLVAWDAPVATVCVDCSKGTYVRSLAHDLGDRFGTGAYPSDLLRLRSGPFSLDEAWTIAELEDANLTAEWERIAVHPDAAALDTDALLLDGAAMLAWRQGKALPAPAAAGLARVYGADGEWLGVARGGDGHWLPDKVIGAAA